MGIEPGVRLSPSFELSAGLRYALVPGRELKLGPADFYNVASGVSWAVTANATWFVSQAIYLGAGLGYAGMRADDCQATGGTVLVRAGARLVVNDLFAMGPLLQVGGSVLGCRKASGIYVASNGQFAQGADRVWLHDAVFLAWNLSWR
jgi:hypothetical protein